MALTVAVEIGLGGIFRQTLIAEQFVVGSWPLSELASNTAVDVSGHGNHGTYGGTDAVAYRGITVPLPEGALARHFDGSSYVEVPDNGGYADSSLTLSLAGGDVDLVAMFRTTTNDEVARPLVQKQTSIATSAGYHMALLSGQINFWLKNGSTLIFSVNSATVNDGAWHVAHCNYRTVAGIAQVYIDGVASGSPATGVTTEPALTVAPLRMGMFNGASAGTGFIGDLAYVTVSREGNELLGATLEAARVWTNVTCDVRTSDAIQSTYGIPGSGWADQVGRTGVLTCLLNNSENNSAGLVGYYSPGHANCRAGFGIGAPMRFSLTSGGTTYYKGRGTIKAVSPITGRKGVRAVQVTCTDWFDVAAISLLSSLDTQIGENSATVFGRVADQADRPPPARDVALGEETFVYALDNAQSENTPILSEFVRIAASEGGGYAYMRGDTTQGGTLVYHGRGERQSNTSIVSTFVDTMQGLEVSDDMGDLVNVIRVTVYPRTVDAAATTVLYAIHTNVSGQAVAAGETIVIEGAYTDPAEKAVRVGGVEMQPVTATTDYLANAAANGTGANMTASFAVDAELGGNLARFRVTNLHATDTGYLTKLQARGKGLYHYDPIIVETRASDSIRRYGARALAIDMPYQGSASPQSSLSDFILAQIAEPIPVPRAITLRAHATSALLLDVLAREPGDLIGIVETVSGLGSGGTATRGYFINQVQITVAEGLIVTATWTLAPSSPFEPWIWDEVGRSEWDLTTVWGV